MEFWFILRCRSRFWLEDNVNKIEHFIFLTSSADSLQRKEKIKFRTSLSKVLVVSQVCIDSFLLLEHFKDLHWLFYFHGLRGWLFCSLSPRRWLAVSRELSNVRAFCGFARGNWLGGLARDPQELFKGVVFIGDVEILVILKWNSKWIPLV